MAKEKVTRFDVADYLDSPEMIAAYLSATLEQKDPALLYQALGDIAKAKGEMAAVAKKVGVTREALYRSLSTEGNPEFRTVVGVIDALDLQLVAKPKEEERAAA